MSDKVRCAICGKEFTQLYRHIKFSHNITTSVYEQQYPGSPLISEDLRSKISSNVKSSERWTDESRVASQERMKSLWEDRDYRERQIESRRLAETRDDVNRKRVIAANTRWSNDNERVLASNRIKSLNSNEEFTRKRLESLARTGTQGSSLQRVVSEYLISVGIENELEYKVSGVRLDIYIPSLDLCIEVGSEYHHGRRGQDPTTMTSLQYEGYQRDQKRKSIFGDRLLILYDNEVQDGTYKETVLRFIRSHNKKEVVDL